MRTIIYSNGCRRTYCSPAVTVEILQLCSSFLASGQFTNNFGLNDLTQENDVSGHWED